MLGTLGTRRGGDGGEGNDCTGAGIKAQLGKPDEGVKEVSRATRGRPGTRDSVGIWRAVADGLRVGRAKSEVQRV